MFKELIELWKGKETLIDEIIDDFSDMLRIGHEMYRKVTPAVLGGEVRDDFKKELYKEDAKLNMLEQTIRRKIMVQLKGAEGAEGPIASCMILMSISKDAERLGDYAKNIFQVYELKPHIDHEQPYFNRLQSVSQTIDELFCGVLEAYRKSDKVKARSLVQSSYEAQKLCDDNLKDLLRAEPLKDGVAYAVLSRFLKRSLAHLGNIATSVFMPVTKIDFFDEIRR